MICLMHILKFILLGVLCAAITVWLIVTAHAGEDFTSLSKMLKTVETPDKEDKAMLSPQWEF